MGLSASTIVATSAPSIATSKLGGVFEALPPVVDTDMMQGLDVAKLPPSMVAQAIVAGMKVGKEQIPLAKVRALMFMARLSPRVADAIVQRALRPQRAAQQA